MKKVKDKCFDCGKVAADGESMAQLVIINGDGKSKKICRDCLLNRMC